MRRGTAQHGYNEIDKQAVRPPNRQTASLRRHPHQMDGEKRSEASKHGERDRRRWTNSTAASALLPAHRVARRGERRGTDPTDGTTDEAMDETSRR